MQRNKLFLLDAMALIYRAHFAFIKAPRITSKGVNTSAIFGFTNFLLDILKRENPTHIGVAFDTHAPTFRHIEFPEYKAQREEVPEDILTAIPLTKKLLKTLNIPILEMDGYEADDIIGTLAKHAEKHSFDVYMVTPDKDYAQLVTDHVFLYKPGRAGNEIEILGPAKVEENMGVPPERVIDFLGLKGDAVDNIPGVPKIGDKTAVELIKQFGTVEEIIRRADEITKNAIRESVKTHAEQGLLSKRLATIAIEAPIPWDENDLAVGNADREAFIQLMQELEFKTTAQRVLDSPIFGGSNEGVQKDLFGNAVGENENAFSSGLYETIETRDHNYKRIETEEELDALLAAVRKNKSFCFDTETTSLDAMSAELICVTISMAAHEGYMVYLPAKEHKKNEAVLEKLRTVFEDKHIEKTGQNLKYDMLVLRNHGIEVAGPLFDTMLAHYVIDPDKAHSMDSMSMELLNYQPVSIETLIGKKGKAQKSMRTVEIDKLRDYACEDADITLSLREKLEPELEPKGVTRVFSEVEMPLVPVLTEMEFTGVKIDEAALREYSKELDVQMKHIEKDIYTLAGTEFNINSPAQLGEVLFRRLNLDTGKKTKGGQFSTREEVLVELAAQHELPAHVLRFRKLGKLKSTYVDALPTLIHPKTGRIHTTFSQAVVATGRLSSNNPNLQNIPIRSDEGREIRRAFIAERGFRVLSADYSQVELRLMAHLSGDEAMIEAFKSGHDIHSATAARVFGVELSAVTSDQRAKAKMVNFGIIYGISAFGLAQRLGIARGEASDIIKSYFAQYPKVKSCMDGSIDFARKKGYVETLLGRRRYLPDINSQNQTVRGFAERNAINSPVQGSAAELIKLAMIHIHDAMKKKQMKSRMTLQVHDELVFEAHVSELDDLKALVEEKMEHALPGLKVPMVAEAGIGDNWLEAH